MYTISHFGRTSDIPQELIDSPAFFGFYNYDEPSPGIGCPSTDTEQQCINRVVAKYNSFKSRDPTHPVIINHWRDMSKWLPAGDIISWDAYPVRDDLGWNKGSFTRTDAMYAWEHYSWNNFLKGNQIDSVNKPVWAVLQGAGIPISDGGGHILVATPKEIRANTYTAITLGVKGIGYFGYKSWPERTTTPYRTTGLYNVPELHAYYKQLGKELVSFNDILVLPTKDYSWEYRKGTMVSFSKTLTNTVLWRTRTNFNYMLKQDGNTQYLIVVNKDSRQISDVKLTINGMTGTKTAKTLGLETSGSQRAGRTLSVNNGQFTDSFDGYAMHIYRVS